MYFQNKSATISLNEYHIKFNDAAVFQFSFRFLYTPTLFVLAQDAGVYRGGGNPGNSKGNASRGNGIEHENGNGMNSSCPEQIFS